MGTNLKYLGSAYSEEEAGLLYAAFDYNGNELKWFPKWKDVVDIVRMAYITEECCNGGKLSHLLENCLSDLISSP